MLPEFLLLKDSEVTSLGRGSIIQSEHVSQIDCPTKEIIYVCIYVCVCKIYIFSFFSTLFLQRVLHPGNTQSSTELRAERFLRGAFAISGCEGRAVSTGLQTRQRHEFESAPLVRQIIQV